MSAPTRLAVAAALLVAGTAVYLAVPASLLVRTVTASAMWLFAGLYAVGVQGAPMWRGAALALAALGAVGCIAAWVGFVLRL